MPQETETTKFQPKNAHTELIERARSLVPQLPQRVKEMDQLKQLPAATIKDLQDAGLFRLTSPRIYGGYQVDMQTFLDVAAEIGRGDASTAWVLALTTISN
jgi:alkylation response protein AidB-like acyl-CoA dehydrogenase